MIQLITPYGRQGPSSRVRVFEWLDRIIDPSTVTSYISAANASPSTLARHPVAVLRAERHLRQIVSSRPERLVLHREASPLSRGQLERRLLSAAEFSVYDFDDALQWDWGEGGLLRRLAPKGPKATIAVRAADRVVAGSPILAEWASAHNRDVIVIPSCVSHDAYRVKTDYTVSDPPRVVWMGSVDNESYVAAIAPALWEIHRRIGARLTLISRKEPTLGALESIIDRVPWSESTQHTALADYDLAIAPLPDEPYERGKCGYKLLQYAAAGTPIVGSPVGINERLLADFAMPAPTSDLEWTDAIVELISCPVEARRALAGGAREIVAQRYSYDAWLPKWREAIGIARAGSDQVVAV